MMSSVETRLDGSTLIVRIPMRFQRRGGRKRIVAPDGSAIVPTSKPQPDGTLVKALARAWRWQRILIRRVRLGQRDRRRREHLEELRQQDTATGSAGAGHRGGDPGGEDGSGADAGEVGAVAAGELDGAAPTLTQGTHPLRNERHRHLACMPVLRAGAAEQGLQRRAAFRDRLLFLALRCRRPGLRFGERVGHSAGRREIFLLVGLGLFGLAVAPLLTFRHRRSPWRALSRSGRQ